MNWLVVTPSVRPFNTDFFEPLKDADWMIVDDTDGKVDFAALFTEHARKPIIATEAMMKNELKSEAAYAMIPRHNPSCKNFGLWWAWHKNYDGVILLDDDCDIRHTPDYLDRIPIGKEAAAWTFHTPSGWYNTMRQLPSSNKEIYSRGYPYEYRGELFALATEVKVSPKFNEGLWVGTPDINGVDKLEMSERLGYNPVGGSPDPWMVGTDIKHAMPETVALQRGQQLPLSIMNVQLSRDLIPAFYQPPDWNVYANFKIRRHDDVYAMAVLKALMDIRGDVATAGDPLIYHTKAGNMNREILSEHNTHLLQGYLTRLIQQTIYHIPVLSSGSYGDLAELMGMQMIRLLTAHCASVPGVFYYILIDYAKRITNWARLCQYGPEALQRKVVPVHSKLL